MGSYTIIYPDELWEKFKAKITKNKTLNEVIIELIEKFVEENE